MIIIYIYISIIQKMAIEINNNILTKNNIKKCLFIKTNAWTKDKKYIYLKITETKINKEKHYYKFLCILPKTSIRVLLNNYVDRFEWELYLKCLHRYGMDDKLNNNWNFIQRNSLVNNLKTEKYKRGTPKRRSRKILVDFELEKIKNNDWIIVKEKEYTKYSMLHKINKFIYFMHKDKYKLSNDLYRSIYTFLI